MKSVFHKLRSLGAPLILIVLAMWLAGCRPDDEEDSDFHESPSLQSAPRVSAATAPVGGTVTVVKGDTLYSLSFKRGLDYREVAAWNGIAAPEYKIRVGQVIRFAPPGAPVQAAPPPARIASSDKVVSVDASAADSTEAIAPATSTTPPPRAPANGGSMFENVPNNSAPIQPAVVETPPPAPPSPPSSVAATPVPPPAPVPVPVPVPSKPAAEMPPASVADGATSNVSGIVWRWPNRGKVIGTFVAGDQTKQGVDIAGNAGDPVLASADGVVVYSGNGLLGYGELIIVKHNDSFLSAYGHNRKRLVNEGDKVRAGQQIAEMGSSASSRDELHFEIRKNGKPVNPLDFLPR
jgi:lipoprotein NlpD